MYASPEIFDKAETIKQALDACTSNFMQILAERFVSGHYLEPYLEFLRGEYRSRKNLGLSPKEAFTAGFDSQAKFHPRMCSENVYKKELYL